MAKWTFQDAVHKNGLDYYDVELAKRIENEYALDPKVKQAFAYIAALDSAFGREMLPDMDIAIASRVKGHKNSSASGDKIVEALEARASQLEFIESDAKHYDWTTEADKQKFFEWSKNEKQKMFRAVATIIDPENPDPGDVESRWNRIQQAKRDKGLSPADQHAAIAEPERELRKALQEGFEESIDKALTTPQGQKLTAHSSPAARAAKKNADFEADLKALNITDPKVRNALAEFNKFDPNIMDLLRGRPTHKWEGVLSMEANDPGARPRLLLELITVAAEQYGLSNEFNTLMNCQMPLEQMKQLDDKKRVLLNSMGWYETLIGSPVNILGAGIPSLIELPGHIQDKRELNQVQEAEAKAEASCKLQIAHGNDYGHLREATAESPQQTTPAPAAPKKTAPPKTTPAAP